MDSYQIYLKTIIASIDLTGKDDLNLLNYPIFVYDANQFLLYY